MSVHERVAPRAETPEAPATADFSGRQGYLRAAPEGVDAIWSHTQAGGAGAGVQIIDVEGAWQLSHEDLLQNVGGVIAGTPSTDLAWRNHGTAVFGEFGGDRNGLGIVGIAPDAGVRAASIFGGVGSASAIRNAADHLNTGDIILIELHRPGPRHNFVSRDDQAGYIALEWWPDDFAAIRYAVTRGVIVVEAAGNGAENLDDALYGQPAAGFPASWRNPLNPANPSSDAVLVGAGAPPPNTHGRDHGPDRSRLDFSNFGSRLDAQGWGREVTTTGGEATTRRPAGRIGRDPVVHGHVQRDVQRITHRRRRVGVHPGHPRGARAGEARSHTGDRDPPDNRLAADRRARSARLAADRQSPGHQGRDRHAHACGGLLGRGHAVLE